LLIDNPQLENFICAKWHIICAKWHIICAKIKVTFALSVILSFAQNSFFICANPSTALFRVVVFVWHPTFIGVLESAIKQGETLYYVDISIKKLFLKTITISNSSYVFKLFLLIHCKLFHLRQEKGNLCAIFYTIICVKFIIHMRQPQHRWVSRTCSCLRLTSTVYCSFRIWNQTRYGTIYYVDISIKKMFKQYQIHTVHIYSNYYYLYNFTDMEVCFKIDFIGCVNLWLFVR